jgi:hypothetical protein
MSLCFLSRRALAAAAAMVTASVCVIACGARGPLDITVIEETPGDASVDVVTADVAAEASEASDVADARPDRGTGIPGLPDSGIVACGACVVESCGQDLITCITSTDCRAALQCIATTCLASGTPDPSCIAGCSTDPAALGQAITGLTCIITSCGSECTSVIAGLTGGGGGTGGGMGGGGAGGGTGSADGG